MPAAVQVTGADRAIRHGEGFAREIDDFYEFWPEIADAVAKREALWFGRTGEGTWPPLSEPYAAWKAQVHPGKPLLVATGDLKESLTNPYKLMLYRSDREVVLGSRVEYARYHQQGTTHMPARKPLIPVVRVQAAIRRLLRKKTQWPGT